LIVDDLLLVGTILEVSGERCEQPYPARLIINLPKSSGQFQVRQRCNELLSRKYSSIIIHIRLSIRLSESKDILQA
jgi:hypothetical protein